MLERYFAVHPLMEVRYMPLFPPVTDRAAWHAVDPADRADLLALAGEWRDRPYPLLTAGFWPGMMWLMNAIAPDPIFHNEALRTTELMTEEFCAHRRLP